MCLESSHSCHCLNMALGSVLFTHSPSLWRRLCLGGWRRRSDCVHVISVIKPFLTIWGSLSLKKELIKDNWQHELLLPFNRDEKPASQEAEITLYQLWPSFCRGGLFSCYLLWRRGTCHIPVLSYQTVKVLPKSRAGKTILSAAQINYFQSALL